MRPFAQFFLRAWPAVLQRRLINVSGWFSLERPEYICKIGGEGRGGAPERSCNWGRTAAWPGTV